MAILAAIGTAISAISSWTISIGAFTFAAGNFLLQTAVSFGVSALAKAFADKPEATPFSVSGKIQAGGVVPRSVAFGVCADAGSLVFHTEWGASGRTPNAYYTRVIALADTPVKGLHRWFINGRAVTLASEASEYGFAAEEYKVAGKEHAWVMFFDGTQDAAPAFLTDTVSNGAPRAYSADRIGRGVAYAVVTYLINEKLFSGFPKSLFVLDGAPLYDISRDTSAGGNGLQRWDDPGTWGGDGDELPAVQLYNLSRGITFNGQWVYGLQSVTPARLPAAHWVAQVEKCRAGVDGPDGLEPIYRSSGMLPVNVELGRAFEAILTTCAGRMSEVGGVFKLYAGVPDDPVAAITDADIISLAPQTFTPFRGLSDRINGVIGNYPSPAEAWNTRATDPIYRPDLEVEDGGRRLVAKVDFPFVPYPAQVQRLLHGELAAARRGRGHTFTLPPAFRMLEPGDTVTFDSARNGYAGKWFRVDGVIDLPNCDLIVDVTEVDPADHGQFDFASLYRPPVIAPLLPIRQAVTGVVGFAAEAAEIQDGLGAPRRPAILARWNGTVEGVAGLVIEYRLAGASDVLGVVEVFDITRGERVIEAGLLPLTAYELRACYDGAAGFDATPTAWLPVTTGDVRFGAADLSEGAVSWGALASEVRDQIDAAGDASASAFAAAAARDGAIEARGIVDEAREAVVEAVALSMPARPGVPLEAWTSDGSAAGVFPRAPLSALRVVDDVDFGRCYESTASNVTIGPAHGLLFDPSRAFLLRFAVKAVDDGASGGVRFNAGFSTYSGLGAVSEAFNAQIGIEAALPVSAGVCEFSVLIAPDGIADLAGFASYDFFLAHDAASAVADYISFFLRINAGGTTNGRLRVGLFELRDVTDALASYVASRASASSAEAAVAYRDAAGDHAAAAQEARTGAETARAAAGVFSEAAALSEENATDAASAAIFARDVSARVLGGAGHPNPIFAVPDDLTLPPEAFALVDGAGTRLERIGGAGKYGAALEYDTGAILSDSAPRVVIDGNDPLVAALPAAQIDALELDLELELVSGAWGSAHVAVLWYGAATSIARVLVADNLPASPGSVQRLRVVIERPDNFTPGGDDRIRVIYYGNAPWHEYGAAAHVARLHRFDFGAVNAQSSALIAQRAVAELSGNAAASLVLRAVSGGAEGAVEVVALSDASGGAASQVTMSGDVIRFDGLGVFGGDLRSDGFSPGAVGWYLGQNGDAEFNNLIVRGSIVDGAVSNGGVFAAHPEPSTIPATSELAPLSLGAFTQGEFWQFAVRVRYRQLSREDTSYTNPGGTVYQYRDKRTRPELQMRALKNGIWSDWEILKIFPLDSGPAWVEQDTVISKQGVFDDVQLRIRVRIFTFEETQQALSFYTQANIHETSLVAKAVVR